MGMRTSWTDMNMNPPESESLPEPLRSVHTSNFPELLEHFGASVFVSTYQAGRLVILRSLDQTLNTHFRVFDKPMGVALSQGRLAVGSALNIWEFHDMPAVASKIQAGEVSHTHDACFLPRTTHWTGDIQIHEISWVGSGADAELVFINTLFSCLCRRSDLFNFEPIWRPSFISGYVPGDCCHLNGLALRDGVPRYATALGQTDTPGGWRENKRDGGVLIDIVSNEIIATELSMPHSPRWHNGRLWMLESGRGGIGIVDPQTGKYEPVAELPGFTRGLSFLGRFAFVGLSQVRESAVFGGIPIAERSLEERTCGVWVIDTETGGTVAFVKFEDAVQEIFAVEVAVGMRYPEVVNEDRQLLAGSFELPDAALADVPCDLRADHHC